MGRRRSKVPVDSGAGDAELGGDLSHGVSALAVWAGFLIHLLGNAGLAGVSLGFLPTGAAAGPGGGRQSMVRSDISACSNSAIRYRAGVGRTGSWWLRAAQRSSDPVQPPGVAFDHLEIGGLAK
jgi:hypothetical protein